MKKMKLQIAQIVAKRMNGCNPQMEENTMNTQQQQFDNAEDQWQWVLQNKDKVRMITLDNDNTMILFVGDNAYSYFKNYIGQSQGTLDLLEAIGLPAEFC